MKERIQKIMDEKQLTPSAFADRLNIGRAVMSHILNGRNNPSLDVVTRILVNIPDINPDWLLTGSGEMRKTATVKHDTLEYNLTNPPFGSDYSVKEPDLFAQPTINPVQKTKPVEYLKESSSTNPPSELGETIHNQFVETKQCNKKITKIIIYYSDNTFESFNSDNRPL